MEKTHAVYSTKTKIVRLIIWLFLAFVAVITIFPVCYVIFGSFKDNKELLVGGSSILPQKWVFDNYVQAWKQAKCCREPMFPAGAPRRPWRQREAP